MEDISYDPDTYWDRRYVIYGHTGYKDELVYSYDQPLRLKAVNKALSSSGIVLNGFSRVLDVGCGVGDFIHELAKNNVNVTGIDISADVVRKCEKKFRDFHNVTIYNSKLEEMVFPNDLFDLVISVTVLQHIIDSGAFSKAIKNIVRVTRTGGYILVFELSPIKVKQNTMMPTYVILRTREEWISAFVQNSCSLVHELCMSQIGVRALSLYDNALSSFVSLLRKRHGNDVVSIPEKPREVKKTPIQYRLNNLVRRIILAVLKPFDLLFIRVPFPKNRTNLRVLIFKKEDNAKT